MDKPSDGWIEWGGGRCPVPGKTLVTVRFRGRDNPSQPFRASVASWRNDGSELDIIAYRVMEQKP